MALNNYTLGDILTSAKRQFGDESGVQITNEDITRWANQATMEINSKNKVLRSSAETPVSTSGNHIFPIPDDCMVPIRVVYDNVGKKKSLKLTGIGLDEFMDMFPGIEYNHGEPSYWTISQDNILIGPSLGEDLNRQANLSIYYVPNPEIMVEIPDKIPLPDRYFDRIVEFVMSKAYELDENWQGHQSQRQLFESNLSTLQNAETDMEGPYPVIRDTYGW